MYFYIDVNRGSIEKKTNLMLSRILRKLYSIKTNYQQPYL